ncbi:hypothetical protein PHLCEN_2v10712 [Hermanssonia centrifuga]|uniref:GATA-type domain-containing protein n=1 Tax=Hermanssonia centrifuga TaxID=98765 RepID=A0A2R6NMZ0_9APHY|nr:hypothetical protein PHLCEN_2v10712 [Hermanssonia centrifuga]
MDSFQFDSYGSYSDASTPRTPSPRTSVCSDDYNTSPNYKPQVDIVPPSIYDHNEDGIMPEPHAIKAAHMWSNSPYNSYPLPGSRGSLLEELNDHDIPDYRMANDMYHPQEQAYHPHPHHSGHHQQHHNTWSQIPQTAHGEHLHHTMRHPHDIAMTRRATFPYVRHDGRDALSYPPPPFLGSDSGSPYGSRPGTMYGEPLPMDGMPHHMDDPFSHSPHAPLYDHSLEMIKTEDSPVIVPSQTGYCRPPSAGMHGLPCLSPHAGLLVQHTDDAASKETQYLRRRCFNCHTTEPPSWRRSTLNPGKIVCNKCGLYERTHLRPRPLRFDELRAGSKTRKQPKTGAGSPKVGKLSPVVKKEVREGDEPLMQRRSSVSSSNGSARSGTGGSSDWDDSVSLASSGSVPSSFNSPAVSTFSIPRDPNSQSPPLGSRDGGIRLPNAPLSDIASLTHSPLQRPASAASPALTPRKSATAPASYYSNSEFYSRRESCTAEGQQPPSQSQSPAIPEVTGWQSVPLSDLAPSKPKSRSNSLRKSVTA